MSELHVPNIFTSTSEVEPHESTIATSSAAPSPWLHSSVVDSIFILAPAFVASAIALAWAAVSGIDVVEGIAGDPSVAPWLWLLLVVGIDVSHVYSTLYRTYFDKAEWAERGSLLIWVPLSCWLTGVLLHSMGALVFWRTLAYLAVFHFVRQGYGFMMIYASRGDTAEASSWRTLDRAAIYLAAVAPVVHWHTRLPREFHWFVDGDFVALPWPWIGGVALGLEATVLSAYVAKEIRLALRTRQTNWAKHLVLAGTALSWFTGIVLFNGDFAFTLTNVVAHGIPYMALIWIRGQESSAAANPREVTKHVGIAIDAESDHRGIVRYIFRPLALPLFVGFVFLIGYFEEGLWDTWVWHDHGEFFPWATSLFSAVTDKATLAWLVPLLALPQATHYVLDGFIWKLRKDCRFHSRKMRV